MKALVRRRPPTPVSRSIFDDFFTPNLDATFRSLWNDAFSDQSRIYDVFDKSAKYPKADARQTDKGLEIDLAVPGCEKNDVDILFENGVLTVKHEKTTQEKSQDENKVLFNELRRSSWNRAWTVSDEVIEEEISASLKNGILTISIPLAKPQVEEKPKPRKISITDNSSDDIEVTEAKEK